MIELGGEKEGVVEFGGGSESEGGEEERGAAG